jgi:signal transduction histidine kinase
MAAPLRAPADNQLERSSAKEGRSAEIAVLAPTGADAAMCGRILGRWKLHVIAYSNMAQVCGAIDRGIGVLVVAEEALQEPARTELLGALAAQPSWSDLPLIILTTEGELSRTLTADVESLALHGNVTLLERPVRIATLVTAVRAAVRARERQFDVRDYLQDLRAAREEAEAAARAKSDFLAIMSHELRTPLNAIGGYVELLEMGIRGPLTAEQREDLTRIRKSQRHLLGLINGVLNYARHDAGGVHYELADLALEDLLVTCEALVSPQANGERLRLAVGPAPEHLSVYADGDKVQQILLNLLSNAIKFTDPGGYIAVTVTEDPDTVHVEVRDSGCGIPADKLEAIFDPFVQIDSRLTRTREGVGLGLAISRDLARDMGGDLRVESTPGNGSTFTLALPRRAPSESGDIGA